MSSILRTSFLGIAGALFFSTAALADAVTAPGLTAAGTGTQLPALSQTQTKTQTATQTPAATTGSVDVEPSLEKRMQDCMAIWDKGTHMTKDQWRRTCKTTLTGP